MRHRRPAERRTRPPTPRPDAPQPSDTSDGQAGARPTGRGTRAAGRTSERTRELARALADDASDPNTFERVNARTMLRLLFRDRVAVELALLTGWAPPDCADDAAAARREARTILPPGATGAEVDDVAVSLLWTEPARWAGATPGPNTWRIGGAPTELPRRAC